MENNVSGAYVLLVIFDKFIMLLFIFTESVLIIEWSDYSFLNVANDCYQGNFDWVFVHIICGIAICVKHLAKMFIASYFLVCRFHNARLANYLIELIINEDMLHSIV